MYDGTAFVGWQRQRNGRSVQGELERIIGRIDGDRPVSVMGAGRTDSGVHAHGQVAHVDVRSTREDAHLLHAVQRMSPPDLAVTALTTVDRDFHARFRATRRRYRYRIVFSPDPFLARYAWHVPTSLDVDLLARSAALFHGRHDFTSYSKFNPDTPDSVCDIDLCEWRATPEGIDFHIAADRFLYGMVRMIVGMQFDVARGKRAIEEIVAIRDARQRSQRIMAAPAWGLSLMEVRYPTPIFSDLRTGTAEAGTTGRA
jgi:tRNA pseudouridine38-40 synthase